VTADVVQRLDRAVCVAYDDDRGIEAVENEKIASSRYLGHVPDRDPVPGQETAELGLIDRRGLIEILRQAEAWSMVPDQPFERFPHVSDSSAPCAGAIIKRDTNDEIVSRGA